MSPRIVGTEERPGILESWTRTTPTTLLGWSALALVVAHGVVLVVASLLDTGYWDPDDRWSTRTVVTATAYAVTAIGGGAAALVASVWQAERSLLMLVPLVLGAFWVFWVLAELPGWLS
jgi:hypothetical protein